MPDCDQDMELAGSGSRWSKTEVCVGGGVGVGGGGGTWAAAAEAKSRSACKPVQDSPAGLDVGAPCCRVSRDGFLGRHLVAARDIAAGEVVLQEAPLVSGPAQGCPPCCVACYQPLQRPGAPAGAAVECPKGCGWPVCGEQCAQSPRHWPECDITRRSRGEKVVVDTWDAPSQLFDSLLVLRCLWLRDSNPAAWGKLAGLESHCAKRKETGRYEQDRVDVACYLREHYKLQDAFTEEDVLKVCGAIQINGYGVRLTAPAHCAVYDTLSFVEHDCVANCAKSWSAQGVLTVRAVVDVPRDTHLSICYTDPLLGTHARRSHLARELLACRCDRCADPSELGTYYSAVRCAAVGVGAADSTCVGFLLPVDPLADPSRTDPSRVEPSDASADVATAGVSPWQCDVCDRVARAHDVAAILEQVQTAVRSVDRSDAGALSALLAECQRALHPDHFFATELRIALAPRVGADWRALRGLRDAQLRFKMALCRDVLRLADVLFKGVTRVAGVMRYELHRSLLEDARRRAKRGDEDQQDIAAQWTEARTLLVEATSILRFEPDVLPEGQVALRALKSLEDLEAAFQDITIHASSEQ